MDLILQQGFLNGFYEILGAQLLQDILGSTDYAACFEKSKIIISKPLPASLFKSMDNALKIKYGERSYMGITHSAGRLAFKTYKDKFPSLIECGSIEKRLQPFGEKISGTLNAFIGILNELDLSHIKMVSETKYQNWQLTGNIKLPEGEILQIGQQHFLMGVLENLLEWIDSRHTFGVEQRSNLQAVERGMVNLLISIKQID